MASEGDEVSFSPVSLLNLDKKLSINQYKRRRDAVTATELNKLYASDAFSSWIHRSHQNTSFWRGVIGFGILAIALIVAIAAITIGATNQKAAIATIPVQLDDEVFLENERQLSAVSEAAEKLAMELQSKEVAFQRQAEDYAALQENLWQAREQIVVLNDSSSKAAFDGIPPSKASLLFRDSVYRSLETKKIALFAALGGICIAIAATAVVFINLLSRWAKAADDAQAARQLREKLQAASKAQAAAEQQVSRVQSTMASKTAELKSAQLEKHHAEEQVLDLQKRILAFQDGKAAPYFGLGQKETDTERGELLEELARLQETISERDADLLNLNQELGELTERLPREIQEREEAVKQVRQWLHRAQGELQHTQEELNSKETECRALNERLEDQQYKEATLNEALEAAKAREGDMRRECQLMAGDAKAKVSSMMELMRSQRMMLSQKLMQSHKHSFELQSALADARRAAGQGSVSPEISMVSVPFEGFDRTPPSSRKRTPVHGNENLRPTRMSSITPLSLKSSLLPTAEEAPPLKLSPPSSGIP